MKTPKNSVEAAFEKRDRPEVTKILAEYISNLRYHDLPPAVQECASMAIADTIAVSIAATEEEVAKRVLDVVADEAGASTIWGTDRRVSATGAALANGTMGHAHDFDDNNMVMIGHPSAPVLSAVMALGEQFQSSCRDLLVAFVAGVETECRIGSGVTYEHNGLGWHTTGTLGTLGAAAGAAKIMKLDRERTQNALGIAGSMASGMRQNFGTMTKPIHVGLAASNGVLAARLARNGVNASPSAIEGHEGFLDLYTSPDAVNCHAIIEGLGTRFDILQNMPKVHVSCALVHTAIDIVLSGISRGEIEKDDIESIDCGVSYHALNLMRYGVPEDDLQARFSIPYCVAAAIVRNKLGIEEFSQSAVVDPEIRRLTEKVNVYVLPEFSSRELFMDAYIAGDVYTTLEIKHYSGSVFRGKKLRPKGHPKEPFSVEDFHNKFMYCLQSFEGRVSAERMWQAFLSMDKEEPFDYRMLCQGSRQMVKEGADER